MNVTIYPSHLRGTVIPPSSKSQTHRLLLAAALAEGQSTIGNVSFSQDVEATLRCAEALGAAWERTGEREVRVTGTAGVIRAGGEQPLGQGAQLIHGPAPGRALGGRLWTGGKQVPRAGG